MKTRFTYEKGIVLTRTTYWSAPLPCAKPLIHYPSSSPTSKRDAVGFIAINAAIPANA